jgi:hypothetical protein
MRTILLALVSVLLLAVPAGAVTLTLTGAEITVSWDEPTVNANGSPLLDLSKCFVEWKYSTDATWVRGPEKPATAPTGGGLNVSAILTVPVTDGMERDVEVGVRAQDLSGNISEPTVKSIRVDRLAPAAPR